MSKNRRLIITLVRLRVLFVLVLLNIAGVAIGIDRKADFQDGRCPPCIGLDTISENLRQRNTANTASGMVGNKRAGTAAALGHIEQRFAQPTCGYRPERRVY